jgi:hypothetical protein
MDQHRREVGAAASACQSGATFMKLGRAAAIKWTVWTGKFGSAGARRF